MTYQEWLNFVEKSIKPNCSKDIVEAWERCKQHGLNYNKQNFKNLSRLSSKEFNKRTNRLNWVLDTLSKIVGNANLDFRGGLFFLDKENYLLYKVIFDNYLEDLSLLELGRAISEEYVGNTVGTMVTRLKKPFFLSKYEHINPLLHDYIAYAEPIWIKGNLEGALVICKVAGNIEEDKSLIYNVLRVLKESCLIKYGTAEHQIQYQKKINSGFNAKYTFTDLTYHSFKMKNLIQKAKLLSKSNQSLIIYGESGTGKELLASAIHNESLRREGPFVSINCASLLGPLVESELFGYSDGAFTGAVKGGKKGKIELAHKGTLFLDEVEDLSLSSQAMLLRALQEHEVVRIGDEKLIHVNFRVICATNKNLRQLCEKGLFRWDLYYRLAGIELHIPSLRDRKEDINILAEDILEKINQKENCIKKFSIEAVKLLKEYQWPGNIRELKNIVETAFLLTKGAEITKEVIADLLQINDFVVSTLTDKKSNKVRFLETLDSVNGKVSEAAKVLNISRATAYRWLKEIRESS